MPYGSRYRRRRVYRSRNPRVTKRTGRKIIKSYLRKKARKGNTSVFKLKYNQELTTTDLQAGVFGSLTNPVAVVNGTGTVNDWANFPNIYDSYKVCAVKLAFIPYNNVSQTIVGGTGGTTYGYWPLYHAIDYNDVGVTGASVPSDLDEYENCKMLNMYKPWKRYMRVPRYNVNPARSNFPATTLAKGGYFSTTTNLPGHGVWYLKMQDSSSFELSLGGKLRVTMYVAFKNRM